jgi:hypothetical protein
MAAKAPIRDERAPWRNGTVPRSFLALNVAWIPAFAGMTALATWGI